MELAQIDPEGTINEAIMDLYVVFPGHITPHYIDVSIRCPHATRCTVAWRCPGTAANAAIRDKAARYGPKVITVALETYGRLAEKSCEGLAALATAAGHGLKDQWAAPRLLPRWKALIQRAVLYATADVDLLSLGAAAVSTCALRGCA